MFVFLSIFLFTCLSAYLHLQFYYAQLTTFDTVHARIKFFTHDAISVNSRIQWGFLRPVMYLISCMGPSLRFSHTSLQPFCLHFRHCYILFQREQQLKIIGLQKMIISASEQTINLKRKVRKTLCLFTEIEVVSGLEFNAF